VIINNTWCVGETSRAAQSMNPLIVDGESVDDNESVDECVNESVRQEGTGSRLGKTCGLA